MHIDAQINSNVSGFAIGNYFWIKRWALP
jgi:hypothetical protein